jgi:nucleotide-binding universal stress UspA family protein
MHDQIRYPTDGSESAKSVLDYALRIAFEHEATIHILNIADPNQDSLTRIQGEVIDVLEREDEQIVDEAAQRAKDRGVVERGNVVEFCEACFPELAAWDTESSD